MLRLSEPQAQFLFSKEKYVLFSAGKRSGKSFVGARWIYKKLMEDTGKLLLIGANTNRQLTQVTLLTFNEFLQSSGIEYVYGTRPKWWRSRLDDHRGVYSFKHGGQISCWSLEKGARGRYAFDGLSLGGFWIDETKDTELSAWEILKERLSEKHLTGIQGRITTTPAGAESWLYDIFVDEMRSERKKRDYRVIYGSTYDNAANLEDGYVEDMEDTYDELTIKERRDGIFITRSGGQVYHAFSDENLVNNIPILPGIPLHIGIDFNVAPMSAIVCQYLSDSYVIRFPEHAALWQELINRFGSLNGLIAVQDEIILMNSNTWQMAQEIRGRYDNPIYMYPDSSGQQRSTNSSTTDIEILNNAGLRCQYKPSNPAVDDRVNMVNSALKNSRGKRSVVISKQCKHLVNDFCKVKRDDKGKVDKKDSKLTHASDAFGYFIAYRKNKIV